MNCTHCNAELPEGAKICEYCDCAVETEKKGGVLRIILGVIYAVAAILMIYMPSIGGNIVGNTEETLERLVSAGYGGFGDTFAAFYSIMNVLGGYDNFIYSSAGLLMAVAALTLLLKKKGACKAAFISGIAGLAAAGYSVLMIIAVPAFPRFLFSAYLGRDKITEVAVNIVRGDFAFTLKYIICGVLAAAVAIPAFILTLKLRKSAEQELCGKMERSTASLMTFLPLVGIALRFRGIFSTYYAATMGQNAMAAYSIAESAVSNVIGISSVMLIIITVYCVLMKKFRYPLFIFPGLGALIVYGLFAVIKCKDTVSSYLSGVSDDIYGMANQAIIPKVLGVFLLLVAVYFWIAATARSGIRAWGQIIFAVSFIFIAIILEALKVTVFKLSIEVPLTEIVLSHAMLAAAIPLSIRKREV